MIDITEEEFLLLKDYLHSICGIDVPSEKKYLFKTRLRHFMVELECDNYKDLHAHLLKSDDENLRRRLIQSMTTHESSFFRDSHPFELILQKLLPQIARQRVDEARLMSPRLRILSAGCSSGQEPYTLAMMVCEWLSTQNVFKASDITILGIDISSRIIEQARKGEYTELQLGKGMPERFKRRHMKQDGNIWRVDNDIKRMVNFAEINLSESFDNLGKFDIILCRNVIIYFSMNLKQQIISRFRKMLNGGGIFIIGASESLYNLSEEFVPVHDMGSTYYIPTDDRVDCGLKDKPGV